MVLCTVEKRQSAVRPRSFCAQSGNQRRSEATTASWPILTISSLGILSLSPLLQAFVWWFISTNTFNQGSQSEADLDGHLLNRSQRSYLFRFATIFPQRKSYGISFGFSEEGKIGGDSSCMQDQLTQMAIINLLTPEELLLWASYCTKPCFVLHRLPQLCKQTAVTIIQGLHET